MDLTQLTGTELNSLADEVAAEIRQRAALAEAAAKLRALQAEALTLAGKEKGAAFSEPTGPLDAYPHGWVVEYGGQYFRSELAESNMARPGKKESGWVRVWPNDRGGRVQVKPASSGKGGKR